MKPTSPSSKTRQTSKPEGTAKRRRPTEEQEILAFLKEMGARPMTRAEKRRLAASGNLGMPDE